MPAARVAELLVSHQVRLEELVSSRATLEEAYFQLTRDAGAHTSVAVAPEASARMTSTLLSEWTKLRTQRGTLVALATMCLLMVGMTAFFASQTETDAVFGGDDDVVQFGLAGIVFAQIAVVVAGASLVTSRVRDGDDPDDPHGDAGTSPRPRRQGGRAQCGDVPAGADHVGGGVRDRAVAPPRPRLRRARLSPVSITDPGAARAVVGTASCSRPTR